MGTTTYNKHQHYFSSFWALAHFFHYAWGFLAFYWLNGSHELSDPISITLYTSVSSSALLLLYFRGSTKFLVLLASMQLIEVAWMSPDVPNHWLLTGMVNLSLLLHRWVLKEHWYQPFLQSIRLGVPCFYGFAAFWKLNSDFLTPAVSCATHFSNYIFSNCCGFTSQSLTIPYGTLLLELCIPILLIMRRTRSAGILLGCVFHIGLGLHVLKQFLNFSSVMLALLFAFIPVASPLSLPKILERTRFFAILCLVLLLTTASGLISAPTWLVFREALWLAYALLLTAGIARTLYKESMQEQETLSYSRVSLVLPILIFINGCTPFLGLKTHSAWQMYGNLSLTHDSSNHLILPYSLDLLGLIEQPERLKSHTYVEQKLYRIKPQASDQCSW